MSSPLDVLVRAIKLPLSHRDIRQLAALNCCAHPSGARKSVLERYLDFAYAFVLRNELSPLYYAQQLDLKGRNVRREYLSYEEFRGIRDARNGMRISASRYNYGCLLRDKLLFERYFSGAGIPVATSLGEIHARNKAAFQGTTESDFIAWGQANHQAADLFLKPRFGIKGKGVFAVRFLGDEVEVNGKCVRPGEFVDRLKDRYLVQNRILQHPTLSELHTHSLNTVRIITYRSTDAPEVFLSYLRIACNGEIADNNANARVIVRVDAQSGRCQEAGYAITSDPAIKTTTHPDSHVAFSDVVIPYWDECLSLVKRAHAWLPEMFSIGWDVALTPNGPLLLEGNDDWGATTAMWAMPEFVEAFRRVHARSDASLAGAPDHGTGGVPLSGHGL